MDLTFKTIRVSRQEATLKIQIFRPEFNNSITGELVDEITSVIRNAENDAGIKVIVLSGLPGCFCTGMDFQALSANSSRNIPLEDSDDYYELLKLFSLCSKVLIARVEGKVNAGGIGLVAACDIVVASHDSIFSLSELLFGLLPACVMPFLIRRVGYQKALWLSLTTQGISGQRAYEIGLVDELANDMDDAIRRLLLRLTRLETHAIKDLKEYMSSLWIVNDQTQSRAVGKITALMNSDRVQNNIRNFVNKRQFPWEK